MNNITTWQNKTFSELSIHQLYDLLKLRVDVFVVEQTCYYPDLDSLDGCLDRHDETQHLMGYQGNKLIGYLRVLAKGQRYKNYISIGRVAIIKEARGNGLGHEIIIEALNLCQQKFPKENIKISAQQHLESFYGRHGFVKYSKMYLEDGIPHIAMLKTTNNLAK
jgi:ElaA protein